MEHWGLEFVDDGNYGRPNVFVDKEPWRSYNEAFQLPLLFVKESLADSHRLSELLYKDRERIQALKESIDRHGLREPLLILCDVKGNALLKDGHHRLLAMELLSGTDQSIPVIAKRVQTIRGYGVNVLGGDLQLLLTSLV